MQVLKFGGASVKDADSIKNVVDIIGTYSAEKLVIVISAMGKTTNYLERIWKAYYQKDSDLSELVAELKEQNSNVVENLFKDDSFINSRLESIYDDLDSILSKTPVSDKAFLYDQIVSVGEVFSTVIVCEYLIESGMDAVWVNVKHCIKTNANYREGIVDWEKTKGAINATIGEIDKKIIITQGFLGATPENYTTTLGREGSDYSGSIFATCLGAEKLTIWKDVPGVLNADPRFVPKAQKINALSFEQANELTFFGAKVIHPKTLTPLKKANIPLEVRSFTDYTKPGTIISDKLQDESLPPIVIFNRDQIKITITRKDDQVLFEKDVSEIYKSFSNQYLNVNLSHRAAYNIWFAVDDQMFKIEPIIEELKETFNIDINNEGFEVLTFQYYTQSFVDEILAGKKIICKAFTEKLMKILVVNEE